MRPKSEIELSLKQTEADIQFWKAEARKAEANADESGYVEYCDSVLTEMRGERRVLKWVLGESELLK